MNTDKNDDRSIKVDINAWWNNKVIDISDDDVRPEVAERYEGFAEYVNYGI